MLKLVLASCFPHIWYLMDVGEQVGVSSVRLQGSMSMDHRDKMIHAFTHDPNIKVFLMSLKAGGVALNLTAASNVFLLDPWWNPAVEQQVAAFELSPQISQRAHS